MNLKLTFRGLDSSGNQPVALFSSVVFNPNLGKSAKTVAYSFDDVLQPVIDVLKEGTAYIVNAEQDWTGPCGMKLLAVDHI